MIALTDNERAKFVAWVKAELDQRRQDFDRRPLSNSLWHDLLSLKHTLGILAPDEEYQLFEPLPPFSTTEPIPTLSPLEHPIKLVTEIPALSSD